MSTVPVENVAEVEIRQMLFGQLIENTLYFFLTGGWDEAKLTALATAAGVWFIAEVLPQLSEDLSVREVVARDLSTGAADQGIYVAPTNAGGGTNPAAPSNVAMAVSLRTASAGRSFRGRNYIAGFQAANVTADRFDTAPANAIVDAYNILLSTYIAPAVAGAAWGVVSRFTAGAPRTAGLFTPIVAATLTDYFSDSQRKRLIGRGK